MINQYEELPNARIAPGYKPAQVLPSDQPAPADLVAVGVIGITIAEEARYAWIASGTDIKKAAAAAKEKGFLLGWRYDPPTWNGNPAVHVSSRGRNAQLAGCLMSLAMGTLRPSMLVVFMDGGGVEGLEHVVRVTTELGIGLRLILAEGSGQVKNHIRACDLLRNYDWALRADDDVVYMPDCLQKLVGRVEDDVFAVAPAVPVSLQGRPALNSGALKVAGLDIPNVQWSDGTGLHEAEHLHCTMLYRPRLALEHYPRWLSRVGHREETILTHSAWRAGWKLLVDLDAQALHVRAATGGIRDGSTEEFKADEARFIRWCSLMDELDRDGGVFYHHTAGVGDLLAFDACVAPYVPSPVRVGYVGEDLPLKNCKRVPVEDAILGTRGNGYRLGNPYYRLLSRHGGADSSFWEQWAAEQPLRFGS